MLWGGERALFSAKEKLFPMKRHRGQVEFTFPKTFRTQNIAANGTKLHVRDGGSGPAVVLLHGAYWYGSQLSIEDTIPLATVPMAIVLLVAIFTSPSPLEF
jgi:hypothetical protein